VRARCGDISILHLTSRRLRKAMRVVYSPYKLRRGRIPGLRETARVKSPTSIRRRSSLARRSIGERAKRSAEMSARRVYNELLVHVSYRSANRESSYAESALLRSERNAHVSSRRTKPRAARAKYLSTRDKTTRSARFSFITRGKPRRYSRVGERIAGVSARARASFIAESRAN